MNDFEYIDVAASVITADHETIVVIARQIVIAVHPPISPLSIMLPFEKCIRGMP